MITWAFPLLLVVAAILVLAFTGNLLSWSPLVIAVQVAAVILNVWARRSFKKGTFRVSAAPGGSEIIRAGPLSVHPPSHVLDGAALYLGWRRESSVDLHDRHRVAVTGVAIARVIAEERMLRAAYPDYDDYVRTTKALVPYLF